MGADARALVDLNGVESMSDVIDLSIIDVAMVGTDIKITAKPISKQGV
jgi:riboflavin biosynthesis pyrimidine reductase